MLQRMPTHCGDETCAACVTAGDFIFLAHHAGGFEKAEMAHQVRAAFERMKETLATVGATLDDMVQLNFYIKDRADFAEGRDVFFEYFPGGAPARMTVVTQFLDERCMCMMDGIAYRPQRKED